MRRNVRRHTDRDTVRAVDQKVRKTRRQNRWLLQRFVIVRHKVNRIAFNILNQRVRHFGKPRLGITHGRRRVAVHRAEISLPVNQRQAHGERLRQTHHRLINRAVAVRVVFTHHFADDTRRFLKRFIVVIAVFVSGVNNPPVHRLQTVAHIRQRAGNDNAHRIIKIRAAHFLHNHRRRNIFFRQIHRRRRGQRRIAVAGAVRPVICRHVL